MNPYKFFEELKKNNNREWFALNKPRYDEIRQWWTEGMEKVRALLAEEWPDIRYVPIKTFRIYRDTRFSTDKTPYKTHIGSTIAAKTRSDVHAPGFYLETGVPHTDSGVFAGVWAPDSKSLAKLRKAIADNAEEWQDIVNAPEMNRFYEGWFGETLKTAPKGWPKDHPMIEYLRLKHIGRHAPMTRAQFASAAWPEEMAERILAALPMVQFLQYSLDEEI